MFPPNCPKCIISPPNGWPISLCHYTHADTGYESVSSITGLNVDGVYYDIEFLKGKWGKTTGPNILVYSLISPTNDVLKTYDTANGLTFYDDEATVSAVVDEALSLISEEVHFVGGEQGVSRSFRLLYSVSPGNYNEYYYLTGGNNPSSPNIDSDWHIGGFGATSYRGSGVYAFISASAVPIPAAAYLFASGLGLLGWMRRRNQSRTSFALSTTRCVI